jgi:transposase
MGWYQLLEIAREAKLYREFEVNNPPKSCPNDGEPLQQRGGAWHCPFDGWEWPRDYARPVV